ncbi:MAG: adenosylmethionine--8-amino-7-oxononanoate transaminase [Tissierellales bacterium]|nr:adenosylmethionine--8-amino-7-oxononanoate transaminase [Tissierellales bacterium]
MNYAERDLMHIWHPRSQMKDYEELPPIVIDHASGLNLYDIDGNSYLDIVSSWWCNLLGHCHPRINAALKDQLDNLEHVIFANFSHKPAIELCEKLAKITPQAINRFFFTDNGSSSVEVALKISFQYQHQIGQTNRKKFMALSDAYHGETLGSLSVGGVDAYSKLYQPLLFDTKRIQSPDCYRCPYGKNSSSCSAECFEYAEEAFKEQGHETCAMIVEPLLQGAAGLKVYPPIYLKKMREICTKYGVLLIADEIATGFGRTGKYFACDHANISPDLICLSKSLTGGYLPMAIVGTSDEVYNAFYGDYNDGKAFLHSHTYSGNPLACRAAVEVLNILEEENLVEKAASNSDYFHNLICSELQNHPNVGDIRYIGLINAIELVSDKKAKTPLDSKKRTGYNIYKRALKKGLLLRPLEDILYFNPPIIMTKDEMIKAISICKEAIEEELGS